MPDAFLATSHEWTRLQDYGGDSAPAWAEIFKVCWLAGWMAQCVFVLPGFPPFFIASGS